MQFTRSSTTFAPCAKLTSRNVMSKRSGNAPLGGSGSVGVARIAPIRSSAGRTDFKRRYASVASSSGWYRRMLTTRNTNSVVTLSEPSDARNAPVSKIVGKLTSKKNHAMNAVGAGATTVESERCLSSVSAFVKRTNRSPDRLNARSSGIDSTYSRIRSIASVRVSSSRGAYTEAAPCAMNSTGSASGNTTIAARAIRQSIVNRNSTTNETCARPPARSSTPCVSTSSTSVRSCVVFATASSGSPCVKKFSGSVRK